MTKTPKSLTPADDVRFDDVVTLIESARARAYQAVNAELVSLYWAIGEHTNTCMRCGDPQYAEGQRCSVATKAKTDISDFKFRYVKNGNPAGLFASSGNVSDAGLQLGQNLVPWHAVADTTTRDARLVLVIKDGVTLDKDAASALIDGCALVLHPSNTTALSLERAIDKRASKAEVEATKQRLDAEGRLNEFRTATCPSCDAVVNLTGFDETKLTYCRFCDCLFQTRSKALVSGNELCTCSECGYFGRVRSYTEFYFYFLLVVYGFRMQKRHLCDGCAGRLFWKVLALNSVFVLGVPSAVWLKVKSITGRDPSLKGLAEANTLARKKKTPEAATAYAEVLKKLHDHPGVLLNLAKLHLDAGDGQSGIRALEKAMTSCSNYLPALQLANALHQAIEQAQPQASLGAYGGEG